MKRKEIVTKLIKEGFSENTLASLNDKQLGLLSGRILSEQGAALMGNVPGGNGATAVTNVSKTDIQTQNALKQNKKPFATYEGEMSEDKDKDKDKDSVVKKIEHKIKHCKDKKKIADLKDLLKRMKEDGVKASGMEIDESDEKPKFKSKTEWLKSKGIIKDDDDKKEETKESIAPASQPVAIRGDAGVDLTEWVKNVVGKNVHPFTSKSDIMGLIESNLTEQEAEVAEPPVDTEALPDWLTYDAIMASGAAEPAEPKTRPTTKPGNPDQKPETDDPWKLPGPGVNPVPKAEKK